MWLYGIYSIVLTKLFQNLKGTSLGPKLDRKSFDTHTATRLHRLVRVHIIYYTHKYTTLL